MDRSNHHHTDCWCPQIRAVFDDAGRLVSLFDPVWVRELLPEGQQGNVFRWAARGNTHTRMRSSWHRVPCISCRDVRTGLT